MALRRLGRIALELGRDLRQIFLDLRTQVDAVMAGTVDLSLTTVPFAKPQAEAGWAAQQRFLSKVFAGEFAAKRVSWRFESDSGTDYDFSKNVRLE